MASEQNQDVAINGLPSNSSESLLLFSPFSLPPKQHNHLGFKSKFHNHLITTALQLLLVRDVRQEVRNKKPKGEGA